MIEGVHIGCSGYSYRHWVGKFYPAGARSGEFFDLYQTRFSTVELNATFYRLPAEKQIRAWAERSRKGFRFSVKAPRLITHLKKLRNCREPALIFLRALQPFGESDKLGVVLFQTPPSLTFDREVLRGFLPLLPSGYRYAFEFRHASFNRDEVYDLLGSRGADFVSVSAGGTVPYEGFTAPFKYFRMHGLEELYASNYSEGELDALAAKVLRAWNGGTREVYAYFNNDFEAYAPANALRLREILEGRNLAWTKVRETF